MIDRRELERWLRAGRSGVLDGWRRFWLGRKAKWGGFRNHPDYLKAQEFRKTFDPKDGVPYAWVDQYARDSYDRLTQLFTSLDEKADSIIKYLGGGTALVALGSLVAIKQENALLIFLLLPSVLFALRAVFLATKARLPTDIPFLPRVNDAVRYAESYKENAASTFIGQWHEACEGLDLASRRKADLVHGAFKYYYRALLLLVIPLVAWPTLKVFCR